MWTKRKMLIDIDGSLMHIREQLHRIEKKADLIHQGQTKQNTRYYSPKRRQRIVVVWEAGGELVTEELTVDGIQDTDMWRQFVLDGEVILMVKAQHIISIAKTNKESDNE